MDQRVSIRRSDLLVMLNNMKGGTDQQLAATQSMLQTFVDQSDIQAALELLEKNGFGCHKKGHKKHHHKKHKHHKKDDSSSSESSSDDETDYYARD